jgi:hypothetical protein
MDTGTVSLLVAIEDVINGYMMTVIVHVTHINHSGLLINDLDLHFQRLLQLFPFSQQIWEEIEGDIAAKDHE